MTNLESSDLFAIDHANKAKLITVRATPDETSWAYHYTHHSPAQKPHRPPMNWRNPFLITYLSVTVVGAGILGYLLYSGYSHYSEVSTNYDDAVLKLQKLQSKKPFPSPENNQKYVEFTKEYRAEYDKLLAKVGTMQKPEESVSPQIFQDQLRANVSQVEAAAKLNGVELEPEFYLGFDQYRGTLPADSAAGPLARELAAVRSVVDNLIQLKVKRILGVKRDPLAQEGGGAAAAEPSQPSRRASGGRTQQRGGNPGGNSGGGSGIVSANSFEVAFVADQGAVRSALDYIANANQFFIIRYLNVQNSAPEGPKKVDDTPPAAGGEASSAAPAAAGAPGGESQPEHTLRVLVGRETLTVALRIEMITFNNLTSRK